MSSALLKVKMHSILIETSPPKQRAYQFVKKVFGKQAGGSKRFRHNQPHQFLLESFGFSSAKTVRKRFLRWEMGLSAAKKLSVPTVHVDGHDWKPSWLSCFQ